MTRLLAILALVSAACAIREPRTSGVSGEPCSRNEDCDSSACFLGECRAPSSALSTVYAEVRSGDPKFGTVQKAVDARATAVADFILQPVLTFSGRVVQRADPPGADAPISDASVVFTDLAPKIPDRILSTSTQSDSGGTYTTTLPASTYQVRVAPANLPVEQFGPLQTSNTAFDLALPPASLLAHVHGILMNGTTPLAGAQVSAVDATGTSIAASAVSAPDGSFLLTLPPGPPAFSLQVGPQTTPSAGDATPSFKAISFAAGVGLDLGSIPLGAFPPPATLSGRIVDLRGAPVPSARVLVLSTGAPGYVLSRQVTTDANGAFAVLVREGDYLVEAMPDADSQAPAMSGVVSPHVGAGGTNVPIQCPDKITVTGTVIRPDGKPAPAGFRVEATRLQDQLGAGRGT
ncbi:MAG: carboxypeptidase regulatory-like domain-containing protein, partial [Myxococcales bacterium]